MNKTHKNLNNNFNRSGIVLLITLVILSVLAILGYTLTSRVMSERLRNQYLIDYSQARYGCDSALKYALDTIEYIDPVFIERADVPDFSDLYALDADHYKDFIEQWEYYNKSKDSENNSSSDTSETDETDNNGIQTTVIPGPYGPEWPLISEPVEIEIGNAKVRIEIEDENAKYPLGWALVNDNEIQQEIDAGFQTFCEMSGMDYEMIETLKSNLEDIKAQSNFKIHFEPVVTTTRQTVKTTSTTKSKTTTAPQIKRTVLTVATQISNQTTSFARLFYSDLLDKEALARPTIIDEDRKESPLKYISTWGTRLININSAPRHVLEAAFIFSGDQVKITDQIIELRRIKPFENLEDLQKRVVGYTDSIEKSQNYIITQSNIFTIKITATCGMARATALIAVSKEGNTVKRIATING